jgi:hypothetical protein
LIEAEQVVEWYTQRKNDRGPLLSRWREVTLQYDGDVTVPLPEIDDNEKASVVNLMGQGLDQMAMRVASVIPDISYPALRPGIQASINKARDREQANTLWWEMNSMGMILRRRARFLLGYGCSPVVLDSVGRNPLDKREIPHWRVVNPMCSFPAMSNDIADLEPSDCIHAFRQLLGWLQEKFPGQIANLRLPKNANPNTQIELLEYNDSEETVLVAVGAPKEQSPEVGWDLRQLGTAGTGGGAAAVELTRNPNRAGVPLTVYPGRITLGRLQGVFDQIMPMYQRAAKLDALELIAIQQGIWNNEWVVSHPNSPGRPQVITEANGLMGIRGEIANGTVVSIPQNVSQQVTMAKNELERSQRIVANLPAETSGESASNIRTAARGRELLSSAVDMPIQEHQEIFAASLEAENRRAVAIMKNYYGKKQTSFYVPMNGKTDRPDYVPNDTFETDMQFVKYSMAGSDINSQTVMLGQLLQMQVISPQTFMEMMPMIEDVQGEMARINISGVEKALLASIEQAAQQGSMSSVMIARLKQAINDGRTSLEDAVTQVHNEMQQEQAAQAAAQPQPGAAPSPDQMPGMAAPPGGQPGVPTPPPTAGNLASILGNLHPPGSGVPPAPAPANAMAS